jgi:hypothetical protein
MSTIDLLLAGSSYKEKPKSDYASARVPLLKISLYRV